MGASYYLNDELDCAFPVFNGSPSDSYGIYEENPENPFVGYTLLGGQVFIQFEAFKGKDVDINALCLEGKDVREYALNCLDVCSEEGKMDLASYKTICDNTYGSDYHFLHTEWENPHNNNEIVLFSVLTNALHKFHILLACDKDKLNETWAEDSCTVHDLYWRLLEFFVGDMKVREIQKRPWEHGGKELLFTYPDECMLQNRIN